MRIHQFFPLLRPAKRAFVAMLVAQVLAGLGSIVQAVLVAFVVVQVVTGQPEWSTTALWLLGVAAARMAATALGEVAAVRASAQVTGDLRNRLLRQRGVQATPTNLALLGTRGMAAVEPYVVRFLPSLVNAAVLPAATLLALFFVDRWSALIVALTLPLVPLFAALVGMATQAKARRQWRLLDALSGHFLDVVRGLPTLVIHRRAKPQAVQIETMTDRYRRATSATLKVAFASSLVLELIATLSVALVAVAVGLRLAEGALGFQVALAALLLAPEAYWPLRRVGAEFHAATEGDAALREAMAVLKPQPAAQSQAYERIDRIDLDELVSGYDEAGVHAPITLRLNGPGITALHGPSGAGKTSLLRTLAGELPPVSGSLRVNGEPGALPASAVAWAGQEPWLIADTVAANLRVGRPEATETELWLALAEVHLADEVAALPQGLAFRLGEDGAGLSAGQQARLAMARVLVADRSVCLLDEPTARLDAETEAIVLRAIATAGRRSTVVLISHRPAALALAERVVTVNPRRRAAVPASDEPAPAGRLVAPEEPPRPRRFARWAMPTATAMSAASALCGVALTATAAWLITRASAQPPVLTLVVAIVAVRAFGIGRPVIRYGERLLSHDIALARLARSRVEVFRNVIPLIPAALGENRRRRGELLSSIVDDVDAEVDDLLRVRQPLWTAAIVTAVTFGAASLLNPWAGGVIAALGVLTLLVGWLTRTWANRTEGQVVQARAALSRVVTGFAENADDLHRWQRTEAPLIKITMTANKMARHSRSVTVAAASARALLGFAGVAGIVAMSRVEAPSPALSALLMLLPLALAEVLSTVVEATTLAARTKAARARLTALATMAPAVAECAEPQQVPTSTEITGDGVDLGWRRTALRRVEFRLRPGQRIGIIGPSGCGKSTLASALVRFLDPTRGHLYLAQTDLRDLALDDLRGQVTMLDHAPYIFASTVVENVRLARPEATDTEVRDALSRAHLDDWLDTLPHGIHSFIGTGHRDLSGGERMRLGLARVLLSRAPVVILDEPTAHLDVATARSLTDHLLDPDVLAGRSLVWITNGTIGLDQLDEVVDLRRWAVSMRREPTPSPDFVGHRAAIAPVPAGVRLDRLP